MSDLATVLAPPIASIGHPASCQFHASDGYQCPNPVRSRGFCATHYKAMSRAGALVPIKPLSESPQAVQPPSTPANIGHTQRLMARALRKLQRLTPEVVDVLMDGMRIASKKGDTSPAQWALLHTGIVRPLATQATTASGVTVNIGVKVSGTDTAIGQQTKVTQ